MQMKRVLKTERALYDGIVTDQYENTVIRLYAAIQETLFVGIKSKPRFRFCTGSPYMPNADVKITKKEQKSQILQDLLSPLIYKKKRPPDHYDKCAEQSNLANKKLRRNGYVEPTTIVW